MDNLIEKIIGITIWTAGILAILTFWGILIGGTIAIITAIL